MPLSNISIDEAAMIADVAEIENQVDEEIRKRELLAKLEKHRYTWERMFIEMAKVVAKRSKDPNTKVGAVLVKDNRVIGIGYNGEPRQFEYVFDWATAEKYDYVIHAEMNAITNATSNGVSCVGADIYTTMSPCKECMKLLIQNKIRTIYYLQKYRDFDMTKKMSDHAQIQLVQLSNKGDIMK